MRDFLMESI